MGCIGGMVRGLSRGDCGIQANSLVCNVPHKIGVDRMDIQELTLPTHFASALINGDESGLSERDQDVLELFTQHQVNKFGSCWCMDVKDDAAFTACHDLAYLGIMASDCATFVFDITKRN
jgi:hypothetical protein